MAFVDRGTRTASPLWRRFRRAWAIAGSVAFVAFVLWCLIAYQASAHGHAALVSDAQVTVSRGSASWTFTPSRQRDRRGNLLFLPGALVDPVAYAPLLHAVGPRSPRCSPVNQCPA